MKKKMTIAALFAVFGFAHLASGATHTLKNFYTASSENPSFPDFVAVGMVDDVQFIRYDSNSQQAVFTQDWMNIVTVDDPQYLQSQTQIVQGTQQVFKANIVTAKERFNHTQGVHTFQWMYGCQWDDETQAVDGFNQYGYDGEDFIALDLKNLRYIAPTPESLITKNKWDKNQGWLEQQKHYFTQECIDWVKKYVQYGSSTLGRKVAPEVSLLQKGSGVACHATGFYPEGVMITWKKDGEEMQDEVDVGETLPNEDGTFQKRAVLTVSPEERKNGQYSCEITHKSGGPIVKILDEDELRRTIPNPDSVPPGVIIGVVVGLLVLIALIGGAVFWKYKKPGKGFVPASTGEGSSHSSNEA